MKSYKVNIGLLHVNPLHGKHQRRATTKEYYTHTCCSGNYYVYCHAYLFTQCYIIIYVIGDYIHVYIYAISTCYITYIC